MIPLFLCNSTNNFQRKSQKIENNNQIFYFIFFFFAFFSETVGLSLIFSARNEFCMPKYPNNRIFMSFEEKSGFSPNFCPYYSLTSFHLKTMIPLFLCNSASNFQRKSQKIKNNINYIFYFIFCIFLKNRRVELSFQCRNEFCMPKYPTNRIFIGFGEKKCFFPGFLPLLQYGDLEAMGQKIDQYHFAEFGVFPSKNHDSIVFMQFCQ